PDLQVIERGGPDVGREEERAGEELRVGGADHGVAEVAVLPRVHRGLGELREANHEVAVRERVVGAPPLPAGLAADARVHEAAEGEAVPHGGHALTERRRPPPSLPPARGVLGADPGGGHGQCAHEEDQRVCDVAKATPPGLPGPLPAAAGVPCHGPRHGAGPAGSEAGRSTPRRGGPTRRPGGSTAHGPRREGGITRGRGNDDVAYHGVQRSGHTAMRARASGCTFRARGDTRCGRLPYLASARPASRARSSDSNHSARGNTVATPTARVARPTQRKSEAAKRRKNTPATSAAISKSEAAMMSRVWTSASVADASPGSVTNRASSTRATTRFRIVRAITTHPTAIASQIQSAVRAVNPESGGRSPPPNRPIRNDTSPKNTSGAMKSAPTTLRAVRSDGWECCIVIASSVSSSGDAASAASGAPIHPRPAPPAQRRRSAGTARVGIR